MTSGPNRSAQLGIERLNRIRRVQNPPDITGKRIERDDLGPGPAPTLADGRVFLAPAAILKGRQGGFAGGGVDRAINLLERRSDGLAVFPRDEIEAVTQQVDDASLNHCLRKHGGDGLGETFETIDDGDQDVLDAAIFQLIHDAQPEFGALVLLEPEAEDFLGALSAYTERDMHRLVAN